MESQSRRYLFVEYPFLEKIQFSQLEKICERLLILIPISQKNVPIEVVIQLQSLGMTVKWVPVETEDISSLKTFLIFMMGQLNQALPREIEFAVLSDNAAYDEIIHFINENGRRAIRVLDKKVFEIEAVSADF
jgi:PIN domain